MTTKTPTMKRTQVYLPIELLQKAKSLTNTSVSELIRTGLQEAIKTEENKQKQQQHTKKTKILSASGKYTGTADPMAWSQINDIYN